MLVAYNYTDLNIISTEMLLNTYSSDLDCPADSMVTKLAQNYQIEVFKATAAGLK